MRQPIFLLTLSFLFFHGATSLVPIPPTPNFGRIRRVNTIQNDRIVLFSSTEKKEPIVNEEDTCTPILNALEIPPEQQSKLMELSDLVLEWNSRLNLVSRKESTSTNIILLKHILPSVALSKVIPPSGSIVDIGTGGGFPGLPLAILHPSHSVVLVDSVRKKVEAVQSMVDSLDLPNVEMYHGRAEAMHTLTQRKFEVVVGRSVASIPKFCSWVWDLLEEDGVLIYVIGGEIEDAVMEKCEQDVSMDELLGTEGISDKRALVFRARDVLRIAKESGERMTRRNIVASVTNSKKPKNNPKRRRGDSPKGQWKKKDNAIPKQRGYDNFKRVNIE